MIKVCEICGENFEYAKNSERRTCSTKCRTELRNRTKAYKSELTQPYSDDTSNDTIDTIPATSAGLCDSVSIDDFSSSISEIGTITCTGVNVDNGYEKVLYDYLVESEKNFIYHFPVEFEYEGHKNLRYISFNVNGRYIDILTQDLSTLESTDMLLYLYSKLDAIVVTSISNISILNQYNDQHLESRIKYLVISYLQKALDIDAFHNYI